MILDDGICTIFRKTDVSEPGGKPVYKYLRIWQSWYKELDFSSSPVWQTEGRQENRIDNRIRIVQHRYISEHDVCVLEALEYFDEKNPPERIYEITRAWHGLDDNSPAMISDLSLVVMET